MTTIVWFSYPPHYAMLLRSIESARAIDPSIAAVVVIDPDHLAPQIDGVRVLKEKFDRGTRLETPEAVEGIARVLGSVPGGTVVKLDSDMEVLEPFWKVPTVYRRHNGLCAGAYALPSSLTKRVAKTMAVVPPSRRHEAAEICHRAMVLAADSGESIRVFHMGVGMPPCIRSLHPTAQSAHL